MHQWKCLLLASFLFLDPLHANWTTTPTTIDSGNASTAAPLVIDQEGNVTSAWLENYPASGGDDPQAAFFSFSTQEWKPAQAIVEAYAGIAPPQLVVDPFGTVTLVWLEYYDENANSMTFFASRSRAGGLWTAPVPLNSLPSEIPSNAQQPLSMVVDTQGNVTIVWIQKDLTTNHYAIAAAHFTSDITAPPTLFRFLDGTSPNANSNIIPRLVVDNLGYVTAVWQEQATSGFAVQAARLSPSSTAWSTPVTLETSTPNANAGIVPQVIVDSSGIVTVVWQENTGSQFSVQAARFTPGAAGAGGAWITYTALGSGLSDANSTIAPKVVVDKNGSVTLAAVDASFSVWPSSFAAGSSSWTYPSVPLNSGTAYSQTPLSMVVDSTGAVTILWLNSGGGLFVQAARGFSNSWETAVNLNAGNAAGNTPLLLVIDTFDNITASWTEGSAIQAARFLSQGSSWTVPATLDDGNLYNQISPKIVAAPSGDVTAVWLEGPSLTDKFAVQAARITLQAPTWTPSITLDNGSQSPSAYSSAIAQQINIGVDAFNNVTVTWLESPNATASVQSARFSAPPIVGSMTPSLGPTTGGTNVVITGANFQDANNVLFGTQPASFTVNNSSQITAISPPGDIGTVDVTVVTVNGTSLISNADSFTYFQDPPSGPLPPSSITGRQTKNRFLTKTDIINIIKWSPPKTGTAPVYYNIYRDNLNTLIGTVPAKAPLRFEDHSRIKNVIYTYYVVSVDSNKNYSQAESITITPN